MAILSGFLLVTFILSAVLLIIIVMLQEEGGEGLGGIFGGGGAAPVGNRQGNILTRATTILAVVFLVSLFGYAWINRTPESANVEAAAREQEAEQQGILNWWETEESITNPEDGEPAEEPSAEAPASIDSSEPETAESETEEQ